jgi:hypothetical protein
MMNGARVVAAAVGCAVGVEVTSGLSVEGLPSEVQPESSATRSVAPSAASERACEAIRVGAPGFVRSYPWNARGAVLVPKAL